MTCSAPTDFSQTLNYTENSIVLNWTSGGIPGDSYTIYFPDSITNYTNSSEGPVTISAGISSFGTYSVSIACSNTVGESNQYSTTAYTLPAEVSIINVTGSGSNYFSLQISGGSSDYYSITAAYNGSQVYETCSSDLIECTVSNLIPSTTYSNITVAACSTVLNACGFPLTTFDIVETLPLELYAPSITLDNIPVGTQFSNKFELVWAGVQDGIASISWQSITGGDVNRDSVNFNTNNYTISSLATGTTYRLTGQSFLGGDSSSVYITSFTTLPDPMTDLFQYGSGSNNILLSFTSLSALSNPNISSYSLVLTSDTSIFYEIPKTTNTVDAINLDPLSTYLASIGSCVVNTNLEGESFLSCGFSFNANVSTGPGNVLSPPQLFAIQSTSNLVVLGSISGGEGATSYSLDINDTTSITFARFPFSVTNLLYNSLYSFSANSLDINNTGSAYGNTISVTTLDALDPPFPIIASATDTYINFYWNAVPFASGYNITNSDPYANDITNLPTYRLVNLQPSSVYDVSFASIDVWNTIGSSYTASFVTAPRPTNKLSTTTLIALGVVAAIGAVCALILIYIMTHAKAIM
jgi:hypothetical protein